MRVEQRYRFMVRTKRVLILMKILELQVIVLRGTETNVMEGSQRIKTLFIGSNFREFLGFSGEEFSSKYWFVGHKVLGFL